MPLTRLGRRAAMAAMVTAVVMWPCPSEAQESAAPAEGTAVAPAAGFDMHGSVDAGYRFTSVKGYTSGFQQLFDLPQGPRLFGVDLSGQSRADRDAFADTFTLSASGLGGDPFPTVQLAVRKVNLYDLRVDWRQSRFFDQAPLTPISIGSVNTQAVTDAHASATVRQIGTMAFTLQATNHLHFLFNYDRAANTGTLQSTRSLDFLGSPSAWGSFARADPYLVTGPVNDNASRVTGGLSYAHANWSVHYKAGYQVYDETQTLNPVVSPELSINVADPSTVAEPLAMLGWSAARHLTTPASEFSYVGQPSASLELRGEYQYYRYQGPFSLDASFQGIARTNAAGTAVSPYDVSATARGHVSEPNQIIGQGLMYRPLNWWTLDLNYRYTRFSTDTTGNLGSLLGLYPALSPGPVATTEQDSVVWRDTLHTLEVTSAFTPFPALTIKPGVRVAKRDVSQLEDGIVDPALTDHETSVWPELSVGYQPSARFTARGSYKASYGDASYTRLSPQQQTIGHAMVRIEPVTNLSFEADVNRTNAELLTSGFVSQAHGASVRASYAMGERWSGFAGLSYQSFLGDGNATFLRGPTPLSVAMHDQEIDRAWQAGVTLKASARLGLSLTGNFDRTTGHDTITGEPPLYGPVTFPYATGSLYYEVPRVGRLSVDLQRTYLLQELLPLNNFSANLLTIHYIRTF
jgi:hypothetical protein